MLSVKQIMTTLCTVLYILVHPEELLQSPHFMIFEAEIRPHSPHQKVDIFLFLREISHQKEKQKQAKLNVFCLIQEIFTVSY